MKTAIAALLLLSLTSLPVCAQSDETTHNELRALRDGLLDAIGKGDIERELTYFHPNAVITWHNAEVSRGHDGIRDYLKRMLEGPDKAVESFGADVNVDELTILYGGDMGVSFGSSKEHIALTDGTRADFPGRWSATLVKEGDRWLVANLHASSNLFENPLLGAMQRWIYIAGGGGIVLGLIAGWLVMRRRRTAA